MKPGRTSAMAAAGVMALGTLIGVTGAGTASAASYTHLCSDDQPGLGDVTYTPYENYCADSALGVDDYVLADAPSTTSLTNWTYPNTVGATGAIRQADNVNYCIQVDASAPDGLGGYYVRGASCVGDSAEEWTNVYNSYYGRTVFESLYNSGLCLAVNPSGEPDVIGDYPVLDADPCTDANDTMPWEQLWGSS